MSDTINIIREDEDVEEQIQYHVYGRIEVWVTVDRVVYGYASELGSGYDSDPIEAAISEEMGDLSSVDRECGKWITPADKIIAIPVGEREGPPPKGFRAPSLTYHPMAPCNVCHHEAGTDPNGCQCQCHELYPPVTAS